MSEVRLEQQQPAELTANPGPDSAPQPVVRTSSNQQPPAPDITKGKTLSELQNELRTKEKDFLRDNPTLETLAKNEAEFIRNSGVDALNDQLDKIVLKEGSTGLTDYQTKSKANIQQQLTDQGIEAIKAKSILSQLDEIHKLRKAMLNKAIEEEAKAKKARAYSLLRAHMQLDDPDEVTAKAKGSGPNENELLSALTDSNNPQHILVGKDPTGGIQYIPSPQGGEGNGTLKSSDPVALGTGMVALGHKSIEFSGSPRNVLKAARAALESGAISVDFEHVTKTRIESQDSYGSYHEWVLAQNELRAIENICHAKQSAQTNDINHVFNEESKISDRAHVFNRLSHNEPGRKEMLRDMPLGERAKLAAELRHTQLQEKGVGRVNAAKYIASVNDKKQQENFEKKYCDAVIDRELPKLKELKTPDEVANAILSEDKERIRMAYYERLDNLGTKHSSKAIAEALIKGIIDKNYNAFLNSPVKVFSGSFNKNKREIYRVLMNIKSHAERQAIQQAVINSIPAENSGYMRFANGLEEVVTQLNNSSHSWMQKEENKNERLELSNVESPEDTAVNVPDKELEEDEDKNPKDESEDSENPKP